jgi:hypothetical protein
MPFLLRRIHASLATLRCVIKMCTEFPLTCVAAYTDKDLTTCGYQSSVDLTQEYGAMEVF